MRVVSWLMCVVVATTSGNLSVAGSDPMMTLALPAVEAEAADCPEALASLARVKDARCGRTAQPFKSVRKTIRRLLRDHDGAAVGQGWTRERTHRTLRYWLNHNLGLVIWFNDGSVAVAQYQSCFSTLRQGLVRGSDLDPPPKELNRVHPEFPLRARQERREGVVAAQFIIESDGTVEDICVLHADPAGYGFEQAMIEMLERRSYTKPMLDGRPVEVLVDTISVWDLP